AAAARITVLATGDTLVHEAVAARAATIGRASGTEFDFRPMFAAVAPIVAAADLAVCHLESMVTPAGQGYSYFPAFGVPAAIAPALASAGYDRCSVASNHTLDRGEPGVTATLAALDAAGLGHAGAARNADEAKPRVTQVHGVGVAHLSYTFGVTGQSRLRTQPWLADVIDPARIVADARAARAGGGAIVVVSLHWGNEYSNVVSAYQRRVADQVTASGEVDLIIGHHTHVPMPVEQVNGRWVLFGLGNHLSNQRKGLRPATTQDGFMATVTFTRGADDKWVGERPVVHPTFVDRRTFTIVPVAEALADPATDPALVPQLRESYLRSRAVAGDYLVPAP
ncbi:MAG TPA: CapA family protein, partial [Acidimicrobiales bacterium]